LLRGGEYETETEEDKIKRARAEYFLYLKKIGQNK